MINYVSLPVKQPEIEIMCIYALFNSTTKTWNDYKQMANQLHLQMQVDHLKEQSCYYRQQDDDSPNLCENLTECKLSMLMKSKLIFI